MKSINYEEFYRLIEFLKSKILNSQLQEVYHFEKGLVLGFYAHKTFWLVVDLTTNPSFILYENEKPPVSKSQKPKPVTLFINSHLKNRYLVDIKYEVRWGRRAQFCFSENSLKYHFEAILIPSYPNFIVFSEDKKVSWIKEQSLDFSQEESFRHEVEEFRSPEVIKEEWEERFKKKPEILRDERRHWEQKKQKDIEKKKQAIDKIQQSINEDEEKVYYEIGEFLKYHDLSELDQEWQKFVDLKKSKDWNREHVFAKAKGFDRKRKGAQARVELLLSEIKVLQGLDYQESVKKSKHNISPLKSASSMSLRKLELSPQAFAYMGKNAKDNVELLKQAQSWDLWFHLKDYPSSYVILRRNKNYKLSQQDLVKIIDWFVRESFGSKKELNLLSFDVIYTECRYVRPIKGDKLGRVNYSNEKSFHWKPASS